MIAPTKAKALAAATARAWKPTPTERIRIVTQSIALLNPPEPSRRPDCPKWCIGHLPGDGDRLCMAAYGPWVEPSVGSPVQMYVVKEDSGQPTLNIYADPRERYGAKLTADQARALITDLTEGLNLIDAA